MKYTCEACDPKYFVVYGFCAKCNRRCEPPLWDPDGEISILDHQEMMSNWNKQRSDFINDIVRSSHPIEIVHQRADMKKGKCE